jgi:hypothetical protein
MVMVINLRKIRRLANEKNVENSDIHSVTCTLWVNRVIKESVCLQPVLGNEHARNNGAAVEVFSL